MLLLVLAEEVTSYIGFGMAGMLWYDMNMIKKYCIVGVVLWS